MELEKEIKQPIFKNNHQKMVLNILFTASWLESSHALFLNPYGITPQQYNILRILRGQHPNPASVNLLIERMIDKMSNASRLVEKLRIKKLVSRHECTKDRRQVDVLITDKGMALLTEIDSKLIKEEEKFMTLTDSEAAELSRLLEKFRG